jgi:hypothetical protein
MIKRFLSPDMIIVLLGRESVPGLMTPKFLDKSLRTVLHNIISIDQFSVGVGKYRVETGSPFDKVEEDGTASKKRLVVSRKASWKILFQLLEQLSLSTCPFDERPRRPSPGNSLKSLHYFFHSEPLGRVFLCITHCSVLDSAPVRLSLAHAKKQIPTYAPIIDQPAISPVSTLARPLFFQALCNLPRHPCLSSRPLLNRSV